MNKIIKKRAFLITIIIIGIVMGIIFANVLNSQDQELVTNKLTNYFNNIKIGTKINYGKNILNCLTSNNGLIILIWILGLSIIGLLINNFFLFFKSFTLGFSIGSIINIYLYKGLLISIIYIFPNMIINLIITLFMVYYANNFSLNLFNLLFRKKDIKVSNHLKKYSEILLICNIILFINNLFEVYVSPFIIRLFSFLY